MQAIIQDLATQYQDQGQGKILLLLHGWQDNLRTFDRIAEILSKGLRIIRLDLPGFGGTEAPRRAWQLDDYVNFVADFIKKIGIQPDFIAGHSFGGRIVIKGTASGALQARKIILISSAGAARRRRALAMFYKIMAKTGSAAMRVPPLNLWRGAARGKLYRALKSDYQNAGRLKETFLNIIHEDLAAQAAKIRAPALLIWGGKDEITPLEDGKRLERAIKGSRLEVIEDAGHMAHIKYSREVAALTAEFINSRGGGA